MTDEQRVQLLLKALHPFADASRRSLNDPIAPFCEGRRMDPKSFVTTQDFEQALQAVRKVEPEEPHNV